jgi:hypothetical protein
LSLASPLLATAGPSWYHARTKAVASASSSRKALLEVATADGEPAGVHVQRTESQLDVELQEAQQRLTEIQAARAALRQQVGG